MGALVNAPLYTCFGTYIHTTTLYLYLSPHHARTYHFNTIINNTNTTINTTIVVIPQFRLAVLATPSSRLLAPSNRP